MILQLAWVQAFFQQFQKNNGGNKQIGIKVSQAAKDKAYEIWLNANDFIPSSAPAYLSEKEVQAKFNSIASIIKDEEAALITCKNDPLIFSFSNDRIKESYLAWVEKLESESKAMELIQMNPPLLALSKKNVLDAGPDLIAQTYFWSYFSVFTRPIGVAILQLLKPIKKSMMSK